MSKHPTMQNYVILFAICILHSSSLIISNFASQFFVSHQAKGKNDSWGILSPRKGVSLPAEVEEPYLSGLQSDMSMITKIVQLQMTNNPNIKVANHLFSLNRLKPDCKIMPTLVDFSPPFPTSSETRSMAPAFNPDRCHCTPCFVLNCQSKIHQKELQSDRVSFERRLSQMICSQQNESLQLAIPQSNYCQVCHEYFKSYEEHLDQKPHILRWKFNEFNQDINNMCCSSLFMQEISPPQLKRKTISKDRKMSVKYSPKTSVEHQSKRKMSLSYQLGFLQAGERDALLIVENN